MSTYEFVGYLSQISILGGVLMAVFAFMLPRGVGSPLGLLSLGLGILIGICSIVKMPDGHNYMYHLLMQAFTGSRYPY